MIEGKELAVVEKDNVEQRKESLEIEELIGTIEILDHSSLAEAVSYVAEVKRHYNTIEARRKKITEPMAAATKSLNALFKGPVEPLARAEKALKVKISKYTGGCFTERARLLSAVSTMAKASDKQAAIQKAESYIPPKIPGLSVTESWGGDVIDPEALKKWAIANNRLELLLINGKVLTELTKAASKDPGIPGWFAEQRIGISITEAKVK